MSCTIWRACARPRFQARNGSFRSIGDHHWRGWPHLSDKLPASFDLCRIRGINQRRVDRCLLNSDTAHNADTTESTVTIAVVKLREDCSQSNAPTIRTSLTNPKLRTRTKPQDIGLARTLSVDHSYIDISEILPMLDGSERDGRTVCARGRRRRTSRRCTRPLR